MTRQYTRINSLREKKGNDQKHNQRLQNQLLKRGLPAFVVDAHLRFRKTAEGRGGQIRKKFTIVVIYGRLALTTGGCQISREKSLAQRRKLRMSEVENVWKEIHLHMDLSTNVVQFCIKNHRDGPERLEILWDATDPV